SRMQTSAPALRIGEPIGIALVRIFHQDAELWRRTGRDRLGSIGAANRLFYWQDEHARYGRPEPARIRVTPNPLEPNLIERPWSGCTDAPASKRGWPGEISGLGSSGSPFQCKLLRRIQHDGFDEHLARIPVVPGHERSEQRTLLFDGDGHGPVVGVRITQQRCAGYDLIVEQQLAVVARVDLGQCCGERTQRNGGRVRARECNQREIPRTLWQAMCSQPVEAL